MTTNDLHLERVQRPVLAELTRVERELGEYTQGDELLEALHALQLACFEDAAGCLWFGSPDPSFPDHDRWSLMVARENLERPEVKGSWRNVYFSNVVECGTAITIGPRSPRDSIVFAYEDLVQEMREAMNMLYDADVDIRHGGLRARQAKRRELYQAFNTFYYHGFIPEILRLTWDQDLHDLVRHPDTWLAHHPEAADMPRDLLLRMHGLAAYADERAAGNDWLNTERQLGIF